MTPRETLVAARKLIEKPEAWTTRHFARRVDGTPAGTTDNDATCWCADGALRLAAIKLARAGDDWSRSYEPAKRALRLAIGLWPIPDFNDAPTTTHADVLAAFDRAIEAAK